MHNHTPDTTPTILADIVRARRTHLPDIAHRIRNIPEPQPSTRNLYHNLKAGGAFIMECKSASPSLGLIRADYNPSVVTYRSLETAGQVLLVALEPEDECGSLFLRLRKGVHAGGVRVASITSVITRAARRLSAQTILTAPGGEARATALLPQSHPELVEALRGEGATILVGERAAAVPGLLTVLDTLATSTGAHLVWVPRRSGERGGIEAGLLPHLLPGGHPVADAAARARVQQAWAAGARARTELPAEPGRDTTAILTALADGELGGLVVGGVDLRDFPDPGLARTALTVSGFTVQLEVRRSEVSEHADVVLPVAPTVEKNGTFVNWEGRVRPFG